MSHRQHGGLSVLIACTAIFEVRAVDVSSEIIEGAVDSQGKGGVDVEEEFCPCNGTSEEKEFPVVGVRSDVFVGLLTDSGLGDGTSPSRCVFDKITIVPI